MAARPRLSSWPPRPRQIKTVEIGSAKSLICEGRAMLESPSRTAPSTLLQTLGHQSPSRIGRFSLDANLARRRGRCLARRSLFAGVKRITSPAWRPGRGRYIGLYI